MKLATTTWDFEKYLDVYGSIKAIKDAGFRYVDLNLKGTEPYLSPDCANWQDEVKKIGAYAESIGVKLVQAHSPNANCMKEGRLEKEIFQAKRSIEICQLLGIRDVVVHAGYRENVSKDEWATYNADFYRALIPTMEQTGVYVLHENTTSKNLPTGWFYGYTGKDIVDFLEYVDHPLLQAVWDTGHGITEGSQYENITAIGKHLRALHVHDNSGRADEHALPYTGILNLDDLLNALIAIDYKGYFTFEAGQILQPSNGRNKRQRFAADARLLNPTLEMQEAAERLLYVIGKSALSAYGLFEE